jgi:LacI family transcriptional regulator
MSEKVTLKTIADRLGLSLFAVSTALSGKPGVSDDTRKKVIETAHLLGYQIKSSKLPKALSNDDSDLPSAAVNNQQKLVLIWVKPQSRVSSYWESVITGLETACSEFGWSHFICTLGKQQTFTFPEHLHPDSVIGMIVIGTFKTNIIASMKTVGLPIILVDHEDPVCAVDCVVNDNIRAGSLICRHIIETGGKHLIFVGQDAFSVSFRERWLGCYLTVQQESETPARLTKWELPYDKPDWKTVLSDKLHSELPGEGTAFICANDRIAIHLLQSLNEMGMPVPDKYKVAGCDDYA